VIPIRDAIPTPTTAWITRALLLLHAAAYLLPLPGLAVAAPSNGLLLGGNLLALWVFGEGVEDRFGRARFVALVVLGGLVGTAVDLWAPPAIAGSGVSASAVATVLGAHVVLFPQGRVLLLGVVPFRLEAIEAPAVALMALWLLVQMIGAGVFWAVLGGFATGSVLCPLLRRPERMRVEWWSP
jgi:membrane associated rhomboid family serine protease